MRQTRPDDLPTREQIDPSGDRKMTRLLAAAALLAMAAAPAFACDFRSRFRLTCKALRRVAAGQPFDSTPGTTSDRKQS